MTMRIHPDGPRGRLRRQVDVAQKRRGSPGFTLLEAIAAFAVIAIVLAAAYASLGSAGRAADRAALTATAAARAESALASVGSATPATPGETVLRDGSWITAIEIEPTRPPEPTLWREVGLRPLRVRARVTHAERPDIAVTLETLRIGPAR